jgi:hypothetical protein
MPWRHTAPMDQQTPFLADDLRRTLSLTAWGALYGGSRKPSSQWSERSRTFGPPGLEARAHTPGSSPNQTPQHVVEASSAGRCRRPAWGAQKRGSIPQKRPPSWAWPERSTVGAILRRHGLVPQKRPHRHLGHPGTPTPLRAAPNEGWSADVTGQLSTGDGLYCSPLTVAAGDRRFRLGGQALSSPRGSRPSPWAPVCATRAVCPSASAPTTVCPWPPTLWASSHTAPPGGSAGGSSPSASRPATPRRTAAMNAALARCRRKPPALPPARGARQAYPRRLR